MNWLLGGADADGNPGGHQVQMPAVPHTGSPKPASVADLPASELYRKLQLEGMECQRLRELLADREGKLRIAEDELGAQHRLMASEKGQLESQHSALEQRCLNLEKCVLGLVCPLVAAAPGFLPRHGPRATECWVGHTAPRKGVHWSTRSCSRTLCRRMCPQWDPHGVRWEQRRDDVPKGGLTLVLRPEAVSVGRRLPNLM